MFTHACNNMIFVTFQTANFKRIKVYLWNYFCLTFAQMKLVAEQQACSNDIG